MGSSLIWKKLEYLESSGEPYVLATLLWVRGSAPQDTGAKIIISKEGIEAGTIGGGKLEARVIKEAYNLLEKNHQAPPQTQKWNLQRDISMSCGGEVEILLEHFIPNLWDIIIFGAGHVSQALSRVLTKLNCKVTVIDNRHEWLEQLEDVSTLYFEKIEEAVTAQMNNSFLISVTKGHDDDLKVIEKVYQRCPSALFIGVIGSKTKAINFKRELSKKDIPHEFIDKLTMPIGLKLGTNDPEEIAISIAAQLLEQRDLLKSSPLADENL